MEDICLICQHSFVGVESDTVRKTLCQYCVNGSNFENLSILQFSTLLDLTENTREQIETEFEQFQNDKFRNS